MLLLPLSKNLFGMLRAITLSYSSVPKSVNLTMPSNLIALPSNFSFFELLMPFFFLVGKFAQDLTTLKKTEAPAKSGSMSERLI